MTRMTGMTGGQPGDDRNDLGMTSEMSSPWILTRLCSSCVVPTSSPVRFHQKFFFHLKSKAVYNSSAKNQYSILLVKLSHKNCYKILKLNHLFKEAARTRQEILGVTWQILKESNLGNANFPVLLSAVWTITSPEMIINSSVFLPNKIKI